MLTPVAVLALLVLAPASQGAAPAPDPVEVEARITDLERRHESRRKIGDGEGALAAIQEMAALDPDHPKTFKNLVLFLRSQGALEDVPAAMDRLHLAQGPGRVYTHGMLAIYTGQTAQAEEHFGTALAQYESLRHAAGQAACHTALGIVRQRARSYQAAVDEMEAALPFLERLQDRRGMADVLGNLSRIERLRGNLQEALKRQQEVLAHRQADGDIAGQALSWNEIAAGQAQLGWEAAALDAYSQAIALQAQVADRIGQISSLRHRAAVALDAGRSGEALADLQAARELTGPLPGTSVVAEIGLQHAETLIEIGRYREAEASLGSLVNEFRSLEKPEQVASTLTAHARALAGLGEPMEARQKALEGLGLAEELDEPRLVASAVTEVGNAELALGRFTDAVVAHRRALELHRQAGNRDGERSSLNNLGAVYFALGDLPRARQHLQEALELAEKFQDREAVARGHNNLGVVEADDGHLEGAAAHLEQALAGWRTLNAPRSTALSEANLAEVLLGRGEHAGAAGHARQALETYRTIGDRRGEASALNVQGDLQMAMSQADAARASYEGARELAEAHDLSRERWRARAGLAEALAAKGQAVQAHGEALGALDEIEQVRSRLATDQFKIHFLARKRHHHEQALRLLMELPAAAAGGEPARVASGFHLAERAHARGLLDLLAEVGAGARGSAGVDPDLLRREQAARTALAAATASLAAAEDDVSRDAARARLRQAEADVEEVEIDLRRSAPAYADLAYPLPATLHEIQHRVLGVDEVLLNYFIGAEHAWVWVVTRNEARVVPLGEPADIRSAVDDLLTEVEAPGGSLAGPGAARAAAERLGRLVVPERLPDGAWRLLVVADGALGHVPFAALRHGGGYLVKDHEIVHVPSASTLRLLRGAEAAPRGVGFLGVADPAAGAAIARFPPLPHARREVDRIAALFPTDERTVLAGAAASKTRLGSLPLDRYRYIHFATHGWLDPEDLSHSGLFLSSEAGSSEPGLLSVDEVYGLGLAADLVVLSACRSGQGELLSGEGLVGLTRGFLHAGARSVVVSLWSVSDHAAGELMERLYRAMKEGATPAAALRQAQLAFLGSDQPSRRDLHDWAAFFIVGDPGQDEPRLNRAAVETTE